MMIMNKINFIMIFFVLINTLHAELIEVNGKAASEFQESAFIKLMSKLNDGKIPYPFSNLLDSFGTGVREEGNILMVPNGRSLVKEFADYKSPRIIVEPIGLSSPSSSQLSDSQSRDSISEARINNREKISAMGIEPGDLYIGFAPNHKALEVISYNPKKSGYDFFVIEDYQEGKTPKIVNNPALCITCHQNEAPIFSRFPWHELRGKSADLPINNGDSFQQNEIMEKIKEANKDRHEIEGINIEDVKRFNFNQVASFDSTIRGTNDAIFSNKVCSALCSKQDLNCQKAVLLTFFDKKPNYTKYPYFNDIENKIKKIELKSSVILDRDPEKNKGFQVVFDTKEMEELMKPNADQLAVAADPKTLEKAIMEGNLQVKDDLFKTYGSRKKFDVTYKENPVFFSNGDFKNLIAPTEMMNPTYLRPTNSNLLLLRNEMSKAKSLNEKVSRVVDSCLSSFTFNLIGSQVKKEDVDRNQILAAVKNWPDLRSILQVITKPTEEKKSESLTCQSGPLPIMPVYKYSNLQEVVKIFSDEKIKKPTTLFAKYCTECHGGQFPFILLPLNSMEEMANYQPSFSSIGVEERLEKKIMPPKNADLQPSDEERAFMLKTMKELKKK
jgi:hypothetical protein